MFSLKGTSYQTLLILFQRFPSFFFFSLTEMIHQFVWFIKSGFQWNLEYFDLPCITHIYYFKIVILFYHENNNRGKYVKIISLAFIAFQMGCNPLLCWYSFKHHIQFKLSCFKQLGWKYKPCIIYKHKHWQLQFYKLEIVYQKYMWYLLSSSTYYFTYYRPINLIFRVTGTNMGPHLLPST